MVNPYNEKVNKNILIREFPEDVLETDLVWHRDKKTRTITPIKCDRWLFQFDNQRPFIMKEGISIVVVKDTYHRILKGNGKLILEIKEHED